jgi:hypothetical protein
MATPASTPTLTQPRPLPPGARPGPITLPPPGPAHPGPPPAARHLATRGTAAQLCRLLHGHGLTGLYSYVLGNVAVISLPHLTIWITPRILTWTHDGQKSTWPAHDTTSAARHLAHLTHPGNHQARPPTRPP